MLSEKLDLGHSAERDIVVTQEMTAEALGNRGATVMATPTLVQYLELVSIDALGPAIEDGEISLGTAMNIRHIAATPVGGRIHLKAVVTGKEGRRVSFAMTAHDDLELVAEGTHDRAVVNQARFFQGIDKKRLELGLPE
ncbi:MAG: hypothetical protein M0Z34_10545 [Nitrospiraceae bacterium]|nr:hypothetical protein [Nitrospiraceae bacterium]